MDGTSAPSVPSAAIFGFTEGMGRLLEKLVSERVVLSLIALNTTVIVLRGFDDLRGHDRLLFWLDYCITVYFFCEIAIKVRLNGFKQYWSNAWNRLDFIVVLLSVPVLIRPMLDWAPAEVVLVVRTARILRLLRGFRVIPDSERLWSGVQRALRASVGVFLVMFVYNLILALVAHAFFGDLAPKYFDDPLLSFYSVFKIFTVEGWFEIPDYIASVSSPQMGFFARIYFTFAVVTGGILGLSLANAVFVDEMVIDNANHVEDSLEDATDQVVELQKQQLKLIEELRREIQELKTGR